MHDGERIFDTNILTLCSSTALIIAIIAKIDGQVWKIRKLITSHLLFPMSGVVVTPYIIMGREIPCSYAAWRINYTHYMSLLISEYDAADTSTEQLEKLA